jgi:phosphopantothenoylcysteine decarboxylase/phosphopantothenate--cysteine ligase
MFKGKNVLLGITGSIAAYKSAELVRLFINAGASVRVIQTEASLRFVTPLTISTLSKNIVLSKMINHETGVWNNHVELGDWADFMIIAPITASSMAKMVNGQCDNLLIATYLSAKCQIYFAPAMDLDMFKHQSTINNIETLQSFGNILIPSGFGELASGLIGEGRMAEPNEIISAISKDLSKDLPFSNKNVLITAGPTYESIDPVRFIGNRSSGKMGIALAQEYANNGAKVNLILGPSNLRVQHTNICVHKVDSCNEMLKVVSDNFSNSQISIFAAAVSDYAPKFVSKEKIKKKQSDFTLTLSKTSDILSIMASKKKKDQFVVGFALETENELENAIKKLKAKNLDMIVLNSLNEDGAGFDNNTNKISIIDKQYNKFDFDLKEKSEVAKDIVLKINELI